MCNHFKAATIDGVCMTCEREASDKASSGPLVNYSGVGRDNFREGNTISEHMRQLKEDAKHLPKDRQPEYAGPGSRWV